MTSIRIGVVSQWYDPEGGSASIPGVIARSFARRGAHVEVLTGYPNYPDGRIHAGFKQRPRFSEMRDGIRVHRVPLMPDHGRRAGKRAISYLTFAASSTFFGAQFFRNLDVCLVYSTPVTVGLGPTLFSYCSDVPTITLIQDLWPETAVQSGILKTPVARGLVSAGLGVVSDWIYHRSSWLAVTSPGMARALEDRGFEKSRIHVTPNWLPVEEAIEEMVDCRGDSALGDSKKRFVYAGNLGEAQGLWTVLNAIWRLKNRADLEFVFAGSGVLEQELRSWVRDRGLGNVSFIGQVSSEQVRRLVSDSSGQIICLSRAPLFEMTTPSKIQHALAFGRPIAAAVDGDAAEILRNSGAALVARAGDAAALAENLKNLADLQEQKLLEMGNNGRSYFMEHFSEEAAAQRLFDLVSRTSEIPAK